VEESKREQSSRAQPQVLVPDVYEFFVMVAAELRLPAGMSKWDGV